MEGCSSSDPPYYPKAILNRTDAAAVAAPTRRELHPRRTAWGQKQRHQSTPCSALNAPH